MWQASEAQQRSMQTTADPVRRIQELLVQPINVAMLQQVVATFQQVNRCPPTMFCLLRCAIRCQPSILGKTGVSFELEQPDQIFKALAPEDLAFLSDGEPRMLSSVCDTVRGTSRLHPVTHPATQTVSIVCVESQAACPAIHHE